MFFNSSTLKTPILYTTSLTTNPKLTLKTGASFGFQPTKYRSGTVPIDDSFTLSTKPVPEDIFETLKKHIHPIEVDILQPSAFLPYLEKRKILLQSGLLLNILEPARRKPVEAYLLTLYPSAISSLLASEAKILPSFLNNTALKKLEQRLIEANGLHSRLTKQSTTDTSITPRVLKDGRDGIDKIKKQMELEIPIQAYLQDLVEARKVARSLGVLPEFEKANIQWFYRRLLGGC